MAKTTENILTGQQVKFSGYITRLKENLVRPVVFLLMTKDPKDRDKKTVIISGRKRINKPKYFTKFQTKSHWVQGTSPINIFSHKLILEKKTTLTTLISNRPYR